MCIYLQRGWGARSESVRDGSKKHDGLVGWER